MASTASSLHEHIHHAQLLDHRSPRANHIEIVDPGPNEARGDRGNLYILIELIGNSPINNHAVREIQSVVERTYYAAGGSVSEVLEQAIVRAHETLRELNRRSPDIDLQAGITCAAIVQRYLVIASAGPSLALVATGQRLDQFPLDASHYAGPIGGEASPAINKYRQQLKSGDALFLGESDWIRLSDIRALGGAIANTSVGNLRDMVYHLRQQSNTASLLGLLLVYTERIASAPASDSSVGRRLPTAVGAAPPVRDMPAGRSERHIPPDRRREDASGQALPSAATMQHQLEGPLGSRRKPRIPWYRRATGLLGGPRRWLAGLLLGLLPERRGRQSEQSEWVGSTPIPEPAPASTPQPLARIPPPERPVYTAPQRTRGNRARLIILVAILIPLLTSAIVGAAFLREGNINQEEGLKLVQLAASQLLQVQQALSVDDKVTARAALGDAQRYLDEAIILIGITDQIQDLSEIIATEMQDLLQIRALYSLDVPLVEFPPDARPHRIIVFDQDIYIFDSGRQVVEHYRINPSRTFLEENSGVILREGDTIAGTQVGRLVDIAWQPRITGFAEKASLLILDRNNNVFRYNRLDGASHLRLAAQNSLGSVGQLEMYNSRLYLADERANQIYRYTPAGLDYAEPPEEWFEQQIHRDLSGLVAVGIDSDIWLLSEDGALLRYRQGQQLPFSLERSPGLGGLLVDMVMDSQPGGTLYLADTTHDRILVFDKEGHYIEQYVDAEERALVGLRGLFLDEMTGILYILTYSGLYAHPLPRS